MKTSYLFILISVLSLPSFGQNKADRLKLRKARPNHFYLSAGLAPTNFRDFHTSPLVYNTVLGMYGGIGHLAEDSLQLFDFGGGFTTGSASNVTRDERSSSRFYLMNGYFTYMHGISTSLPSSWNLKVGGSADVFWNIRINPTLGNAVSANEFIGTLFASGKISKDISRTETINKSLLFLKWKKKPKKRALSYGLHLGILNTNYRNGFAYVNQTSITEDPSDFDEYTLEVSGLRLKSDLRYTSYLTNGNAISFGYSWDAYRTGKDDESLEMAMHRLSITLLFKTK